MYKVLQDQIASEDVEVTIQWIDRRFQSNKPIIRIEKGDFNLVEALRSFWMLLVEMLEII